MSAQRRAQRVRLDQLCVQRGLAPSRHRAQAMILAGDVWVNGQPSAKAGTLVAEDAELTCREQSIPFVSRGGLKLAAALDSFTFDCDGRVALDVGASTGGFTDCLLQRGARHVIAVDVGYGQLAWRLRQDARVTSIERTNARYLTEELLQRALDNPGLWPPSMAVVDVSFISLVLVLPAVSGCLPPQSPIIALVKPQFEAGRQDVGRGGVVRDADARQRAIDKVVAWAQASHYGVVAGLDCPVAGPKGNVEYLLQLTTPREHES
jgi:23S rRNA (cytidine1920-2'-O)/16S rRNA (cytidine1409-2'-O)-methyltransferase